MTDAKPSIQFLKGKRVVLRPVLREDVHHLLRWINDEDVTRYLKAYLPMMEGDEEEWVEGLRKKKQTELVFIITADNGKPIGIMGLHGISWRNRTAVTGALIGEKEYWGMGCGTEAKMLLLNYAFNTLNLRKVCSSVIAFNRRSYAYQVKCGYKQIGRRHRQMYRNGRYWDEILMEVFKKDWTPLWRKYREKHLR